MFSLKSAPAGAAFSLAIIAGISTVQAQTTDPVHVATCVVSHSRVIPKGANGGSMFIAGSLHVRFMDISKQTISQVTFTLGDGTTLVDKGTFSPNVMIDHTLNLSHAQSHTHTCTVSSVEFTNGGSWSAQ